MQEKILHPYFLKEVPSSISQIPKTLQRYYQMATNHGFLRQKDPRMERYDIELQYMYGNLEPEEKIQTLLDTFAPFAFERPDFCIPLIVSEYRNPLFEEGFVSIDPQMRGLLVGSSLRRKASLEHEQALYSLGMSSLSNKSADETRIELTKLTSHIAALHNVNVELLP